ncbi:hypothetical protein E2F48_06220 [Arthrobacter crusticola]|uniref:Phosphodiesterase n=1 Tax=Arthrobacter crusticola TaxID=2547960 RepID=A0A4R5TZP4_9MICC|nr:hypothetical protein [Arthrobacter crusticola]TDK26767.1 hypothetical protein E2F48_06220 [Arthrobacter crusticola]
MGAFRALKVLRPSRPIHPRGVRLTGYLAVDGGASSGIPWLDTAGSTPVEARLSRSVGLPGPLPDIIGLAVRIPSGDAYADLLLASTGSSPLGRFVLIPRLNIARSPLTTMMPYRGAQGPVLLAARTTGQRPTPDHSGRRTPARLPASLPAFRRRLAGRAWPMELSYASPLGPWIRFGTLTLTVDPDQGQEDLRFDPVRNPLPTASTYEWAAELRRGSYAVARSPRHNETDERTR